MLSCFPCGVTQVRPTVFLLCVLGAFACRSSNQSRAPRPFVQGSYDFRANTSHGELSGVFHVVGEEVLVAINENGARAFCKDPFRSADRALKRWECTTLRGFTTFGVVIDARRPGKESSWYATTLVTKERTVCQLSSTDRFGRIVCSKWGTETYETTETSGDRLKVTPHVSATVRQDQL